MFPVFETERLILREITEKDAHGIFNCFSNNAVTRFYGQDTLTTLDQAKQFVEAFSKNYNEKRGIRWGIELKGKEGIIGTIGFHAWSPKYKRAEIGYELHPDYWRKRYATEAVKKVVSFGFNELGLTRIGAVVFIDNHASNQLLIKLGFEKEGILRNYMYQNGVPYDTNVYSILKSS
ncbi:N-acetyltransferase [Peribacillus cavernae]|uniref:N-acetyltransferase n=1 Tax=Peribacillus cavernae TaxID=1674310 RepID=A0A3S0W3Z5_9BACI|nr:GNAT family N-acetyltransferase [Peribacillus cavernae]MDQ0219812.1 ribosomal-protein-alanine N-acetyltransferase [Peribacillus cavernae]RUQ27204.1 N-acetyltransferase [Peribacillus cavernae]